MGMSALTEHSLVNTGPLHVNLSAARFVEEALRRHEGILTERGALVAYTGAHTGRSPKDRFLVVDPAQKSDIWWGSVNREMPAAVFDRLLDRVRAYYQGRERRRLC
jgi:phosphoenolpyruvate carboxykinase (ATP)